MCFGNQDSDPTQQPIKITQASEAQLDSSAPSKRKEQKKRPHTDPDDHEAHVVHQSEKANLDSKKSDPGHSQPLTRKQIRDKYNGKQNNVGMFAGNNYDFV